MKLSKILTIVFLVLSIIYGLGLISIWFTYTEGSLTMSDYQSRVLYGNYPLFNTFSFIVFVVFLFCSIILSSETETLLDSSHKNCPNCSELILKTAKKCKHCHSKIKNDTKIQTTVFTETQYGNFVECSKCQTLTSKYNSKCWKCGAINGAS